MTLEQSGRMAPDRVFSLVTQCLHSWVRTDNGLIAQSPRQTTKHPDPLPQVRVLLTLVGHRIRTWNLTLGASAADRRAPLIAHTLRRPLRKRWLGDRHSTDEGVQLTVWRVHGAPFRACSTKAE